MNWSLISLALVLTFNFQSLSQAEQGDHGHNHGEQQNLFRKPIEPADERVLPAFLKADFTSKAYGRAIEAIRQMNPKDPKTKEYAHILQVRLNDSLELKPEKDSFEERQIKMRQLGTLMAFEKLAPDFKPNIFTLKQILQLPVDKKEWGNFDPFAMHNHHLHMWAAKVIRKMKKDGQAAIPELLKMMEEGSSSASRYSIRALGAVGLVKNYDTVGALEKKLNAFKHEEKQEALMALAELGKASQETITKLKQLMFQPVSSYSMNWIEMNGIKPDAAYAYWKITGDAEKAKRSLSSCLRDLNYRETAMQHLYEMGVDPYQLYPGLRADLLKEEVEQPEVKNISADQAKVQELQRKTKAAVDQAKKEIQATGSTPDPSNP